MFNKGEYFTCLKCGATFGDTTKVDERNIVVPVHGCPHCAAQHSVNPTNGIQASSQAVSTPEENPVVEAGTTPSTNQ